MEILRYQSHEKGMLVAFFDLKVIKWGSAVIRGMRLFNKNGHKWVTFPSDKVEKDGETQYYPYIRFEDKATQQAFSDKVVKAIEEYCALQPKKEEENPDDLFLEF